MLKASVMKKLKSRNENKRRFHSEDLSSELNPKLHWYVYTTKTTLKTKLIYYMYFKKMYKLKKI